MAHAFDENFEFNCPQFVDLNCVDNQDNDNSDYDEYFRYDHEAGGIPVENNIMFDKEENNPDEQTEQDEDSEDATHHKDSGVYSQPREGIKPANICSDLSVWRAKGSTKTAGATKKSKHRGSPRLRLAANKLKKRTALMAPNSATQSPACNSPHAKRRRVRTNTPDAMLSSTNTTPQKTQSVPCTPSMSQGPMTRGALKRAVSNTHLPTGNSHKHSARKNTAGKAASKAGRQLGITSAVTPSFMKRKPMTALVTNHYQTYEEMEMQRIRELRLECDRMRKVAAASRELALAPKASKLAPVKHITTKTEEFHFATDGRIKDAKGDNYDESTGDFIHSLRSNDKQQDSDKRPRMTRVKPFNLHESKPKSSSSSYVSMAEAINAFSTKTPVRFRRSKRTRSKENIAVSHLATHQIVIPKTPRLQTKGRNRHTHIVSQAELDEQELEDIKQHQFKAHPLNEKVFKKPAPKKVVAKPLTKTEAFALTTVHSRAALDPEEQHQKFHAKPLPVNILKGVVGVKAVHAHPTTVPKSPAFALRNRVKPPKPQHLEMEDKRILRSHAAPHGGVPFQPQLPHRHTETVAFSFESREAHKKVDREAKLLHQEEEERKAREFHAQNMPLTTHSHSNYSHCKPRPNTQPEPFVLESDHRGKRKRQQWKQQVEEELHQEQLMATEFKAQPCDVVHKEPFIPAKSDKPVTQIEDVSLNTETRSMSRAQWDAWRCEKQAQADQIIAQREKQKEEELDRQVNEMRQQAVHKPGPVRHYKPVRVKPSKKSPTKPHTPKFSDRLRRMDKK